MEISAGRENRSGSGWQIIIIQKIAGRSQSQGGGGGEGEQSLAVRTSDVELSACEASGEL